MLKHKPESLKINMKSRLLIPSLCIRPWPVNKVLFSFPLSISSGISLYSLGLMFQTHYRVYKWTSHPREAIFFPIYSLISGFLNARRILALSSVYVDKVGEMLGGKQVICLCDVWCGCVSHPASKPEPSISFVTLWLLSWYVNILPRSPFSLCIYLLSAMLHLLMVPHMLSTYSCFLHALPSHRLFHVL